MVQLKNNKIVEANNFVKKPSKKVFKDNAAKEDREKKSFLFMMLFLMLLMLMVFIYIYWNILDHFKTKIVAIKIYPKLRKFILRKPKRIYFNKKEKNKMKKKEKKLIIIRIQECVTILHLY